MERLQGKNVSITAYFGQAIAVRFAAEGRRYCNGITVAEPTGRGHKGHGKGGASNGSGRELSCRRMSRMKTR